jgi:hypothetical protein
MKFKVRTVEEAINVSKMHPLAKAGTLLFGLAAMFALTIIVLMMLVGILLNVVSPQKEAALFANWMPSGFESEATPDARLHETQALVDRLSRHWPDAN